MRLQRFNKVGSMILNAGSLNGLKEAPSETGCDNWETLVELEKLMCWMEHEKCLTLTDPKFDEMEGDFTKLTKCSALMLIQQEKKDELYHRFLRLQAACLKSKHD